MGGGTLPLITLLNLIIHHIIQKIEPESYKTGILIFLKSCL
jgi:hypothetical protein